MDRRRPRVRGQGRPVADLAAEHGTPLFAYSARRIRSQVTGLRRALDATGLSRRVHSAMKANRYEGDLLVILPGGAYGASMSSDHCMRGTFAEVVVGG